ncbi:NAD(P)H-binding protein [Anaerobacillus sp. CMMVII]|nr:NAD(P)H-binding protein [Anaerobacillus sp. CMMVII]
MLELALSDGHHVTAFVRDPSKLKSSHPALCTFVGNALNKIDINQAVPRHDLIISAMGTDGKETLSESMPRIIQAMEVNRIKRIITIGTAGILKSRVSPELYRYQSAETKRRSPRATRAAQDHRYAYEALALSNLDWTVICPTYLPDGEKLGTYRHEIDFLPLNGESISVPDTAQFAYNQISSSQFLNYRVGLAY